jgi:hypothetical protein
LRNWGIQERSIGRRVAGSLLLAVLLSMSAVPAVAIAPQPVLPVGTGPQGPGQDVSPPGSESAKPNCPAGSPAAASAAVAALMFGDIGRVRATYPNPVVPVKIVPPATRCSAQISLSLEIKSPNERKPEGADGSLDELLIPRSSLESGFTVTVPANDRIISLSDPGEDWDLTKTSCTCAGWASASRGVRLAGAPAIGELASYPAPVIPVGPAGGGCSGPAVFATASSPHAMRPGGDARGFITTYPAPVVPVGTMPQVQRQPASISWDGSGTITIDDANGAGGTFDCVWTVELVKGQLAVRTITEPQGRESQFAYQVSPRFFHIDSPPTTMSGVAPGNQRKLRNGPWSVELTNLGEAWKLKSSQCSESDGTTTSSAQGTAASVGLDAGDEVKCSFTLKLTTLKPGRYRNNNAKARLICPGVPISITARGVSDVGRVSVRQGGDVLVGRGIASKPVTLHRSEDDPLRYTGQFTIRQRGGRVDFKINMDVLTDETARGAMVATIRVKGQRCTIRRTFRTRWLGGG